MKSNRTKLIVALAVAVFGIAAFMECPTSISKQLGNKAEVGGVQLASRYPMRARTPDFFARSKASNTTKRR